MRDLRTKLYTAYNQAIAETSQHIERLPKTTENTAELNRLTETLRQYVAAREALVPEIEEAQDDLFLPGPRAGSHRWAFQLRVKEAIARDAVDKIDERIAATASRSTRSCAGRDGKSSPASRRTSICGATVRQRREGTRSRPFSKAATRLAAVAWGLFDDPGRGSKTSEAAAGSRGQREEEYAAKAAVFAERLQEFLSLTSCAGGTIR